MKNKEKAAKEVFGATDKCLQSSFILQDGSIVDLRDEEGYEWEHAEISKIYSKEESSQYASPQHFLIDADAISLHCPYRGRRSYIDTNAVNINIESPIRGKQWDKLEECICYIEPNRQKKVYYEFEDKDFHPLERGEMSAYTPHQCFSMIDKLRKKFRIAKRKK